MELTSKHLNKKLRRTWKNVVYRCTNPNDTRYDYYSKTGVCDEWLDYKNFRHDLLGSFVLHVGLHGLKETTIERIDNTKGYSKENCKWATWKEQRENSSHPPLPILTKECPQCRNSYRTKSVSKMFCSNKCSIDSRRVPIEVQKANHKIRAKQRYHGSLEVRQRQAKNSKKWLEKKLKEDPSYALKRKQIDKRAHEKYRATNPQKKYCELTEAQREQRKVRSRIHHAANREKRVAQMKRYYQQTHPKTQS